MDMSNEETQSPENPEPASTVEPDPPPPSSRRYSSEEVAEIIRLSLQDEAKQQENSVDYDELLAIAREVGVDSDRIDKAVELLEDEQLAKDKAEYLWSRFRTHCILFIGVNLLCITINVLTSTNEPAGSGVFWSMYVLFGWGFFLLGHYAGLRYAPQFVEMAMERTQHLANARYQSFFEDDGNVGFTVADPMGLTETMGLLAIENDKLVIEYQTLDSMVGFLKTRVKAIEIDFENLTAARIEQKLWSADLVLQGKNMRTFKNAPGSSGGRLRLKLNRQSRRAAERLTQEIRANLN
ncbi:MAG: 2TM domain-containing protein [Pseudomonadales bacterium]|nr:2TM domain-containing protein [Pseudomonadales bacterium]